MIFSTAHALGHQQIPASLLNRLRVLANCANHQFRLGEASQSSDLRIVRITHLDDILGFHESE